jgi:hypothetical protein
MRSPTSPVARNPDVRLQTHLEQQRRDADIRDDLNEA